MTNNEEEKTNNNKQNKTITIKICFFLSLRNILLTYCDLFFFKVLCFTRFEIFNASGGAVAQSVERATPGEEVPGSIPAVAARSLLVGSVSV